MRTNISARLAMRYSPEYLHISRRKKSLLSSNFTPATRREFSNNAEILKNLGTYQNSKWRAKFRENLCCVGTLDRCRKVGTQYACGNKKIRQAKLYSENRIEERYIFDKIIIIIIKNKKTTREATEEFSINMNLQNITFEVTRFSHDERRYI